VVRRSVPKPGLIRDKVTNRKPFCNNVNSHQFVRKVILSVDILRDQSVSYKESAANSGVPVSALGGGRLRSMSFRWYYPDQVRPVFLRTNSLPWHPFRARKREEGDHNNAAEHPDASLTEVTLILQIYCLR
jgi:hypothetical protein